METHQAAAVLNVMTRQPTGINPRVAAPHTSEWLALSRGKVVSNGTFAGTAHLALLQSQPHLDKEGVDCLSLHNGRYTALM